MKKYYRVKFEDGSYYGTARGYCTQATWGVPKGECDDFYYVEDARELVELKRSLGVPCRVVSYTVSK